MAPGSVMAFTALVRALIVANGEAPSPALARELAGRAGLVVAADGGANRAYALGLTVGAVVGDLDSVSASVRAVLPASAFHRDADAGRTDLQKAIEFAIASGATDIDVIGAGGGRADHALANLSVLTLYRGHGRVVLHDDRFQVRRVDGYFEFEAPRATVVSLVALAPCSGLTTRGLRWELENADLEFSPHGIHNEVASSPASVAVASGDLLLFVGRWQEHHA